MLAKIACESEMHFLRWVGNFQDGDISHHVYKCTACEKLFIEKEEL